MGLQSLEVFSDIIRCFSKAYVLLKQELSQSYSTAYIKQAARTGNHSACFWCCLQKPRENIKIFEVLNNNKKHTLIENISFSSRRTVPSKNTSQCRWLGF